MAKTVRRKIRRVRDPNFAPMIQRKSGIHPDRRRAIQEELSKLEIDEEIQREIVAQRPPLSEEEGI